MKLQILHSFLVLETRLSAHEKYGDSVDFEVLKLLVGRILQLTMLTLSIKTMRLRWFLLIFLDTTLMTKLSRRLM